MNTPTETPEERAEDLRLVRELERQERDAPPPPDHWASDTLTFAYRPPRRPYAR